jgi:hypothetical protein
VYDDHQELKFKLYSSSNTKKAKEKDNNPVATQDGDQMAEGLAGPQQTAGNILCFVSIRMSNYTWERDNLTGG